MKISELITELQEIEKEYGDDEVWLMHSCDTFGFALEKKDLLYCEQTEDEKSGLYIGL